MTFARIALTALLAGGFLGSASFAGAQGVVGASPVGQPPGSTPLIEEPTYPRSPDQQLVEDYLSIITGAGSSERAAPGQPTLPNSMMDTQQVGPGKNDYCARNPTSRWCTGQREATE